VLIPASNNLTYGNGVIRIRVGYQIQFYYAQENILICNPWKDLKTLWYNSNLKATGFSINEKGYIGAVSNYSLSDYKYYFNEYDPLKYNWSGKIAHGGNGIMEGTGFSVGNFGYLGFGIDKYGTQDSTFWQFNNQVGTSGQWTKKASLSNIYNPTSFVIGNSGYIISNEDLWEYSVDQDIWNKKSSIIERSNIVRDCISFSINGKGYYGLGLDDSNKKALDYFWEYDPSINSWTQKHDFPGGARYKSVGFSLNGKGYVGLGMDNSGKRLYDFWEYNPITDNWNRVTFYLGGGWVNAACFSINNKAYVVTGYDGISDIEGGTFWEFDPSKLKQ
jgi:hypothetical protein